MLLVLQYLAKLITQSIHMQDQKLLLLQLKHIQLKLHYLQFLQFILLKY